jgi:polyhydroxybutyrate depolymerase
MDKSMLGTFVKLKHTFRTLLCIAGMLPFGQDALAETLSRTIIHDGKERTYLLTTPDASVRGKMPLVVALHFYPGSGRAMSDLTGFSTIAEREGFLVVYPDGLNGGFNALMCCGTEDDVGFIRAVIEDVSKDYAVDAYRIYATGISNGGDLTYRLAAELPGVFAAIAPVSGGMSEDWIKKPTGNLPTRPVSLIAFHGKRDRHQEAFAKGIAFWAQRQKCDTAPAIVEGGNVELRRGVCADGSAVAFYELPEMGHAWPGGAGDMGYSPSPINATDLIWTFFRDHPRR